MNDNNSTLKTIVTALFFLIPLCWFFGIIIRWALTSWVGFTVVATTVLLLIVTS